MLSSDLKRLDAHCIPEDKGEVRLFGVVRNEKLASALFYQLLSPLGRYAIFHRRHDSQDGTAEFLLAWPDCCVFQTAGSYAVTCAGLDCSILGRFLPCYSMCTAPFLCMRSITKEVRTFSMRAITLIGITISCAAWVTNVMGNCYAKTLRCRWFMKAARNTGTAPILFGWALSQAVPDGRDVISVQAIVSPSNLANPKESHPTDITQLLFRSASEIVSYI
jgi:hypothetical protein